MTSLPRLELAELDSPFDEALILVSGHEEETIRLECTGARELAEDLVRLVNRWKRVPIDREQRSRFATIERTIVDYLESVGLAAEQSEAEWYLYGSDTCSLSALAAAIDEALSRTGAAA